MNKEFIPYDEALALKELGFDEECSSFYYKDLGTIYQRQCSWDVSNDDAYYYTEMVLCSAPLYQQAFRWFRENYNMHFFGQYFTDGKWRGTHSNKEFDTYEELQLACLKKLIEIVKGNL